MEKHKKTIKIILNGTAARQRFCYNYCRRWGFILRFHVGRKSGLVTKIVSNSPLDTFTQMKITKKRVLTGPQPQSDLYRGQPVAAALLKVRFGTFGKSRCVKSEND